MPDMPDLMTRLVALAIDPIPDATRQVQQLSMLDWLACGMAGASEPVARIARDLITEDAGAGQATMFGGGKAPMRGAALVNGAASHALDYDDTHFAHIGHPSVVVMSAALAVAEHVGADMSGLTDAALRGAEASVRVGLALGRGHYQIGYHQTATAGAFGAALAAGVLLQLPPDRLAQTLGLVSTQAAGLKSQFGTMGKPLNAGFAAANGVTAALLVARGLVSNPAALEGTNGFLTTHHADGALHHQPDGWLMADVSHKFHACCHGLHATLEALAKLAPVPVARVQSVTITTHSRWLTVCNQPAPDTGLGAKFSYQAVTALALLGYDTAALSTYTDELAQDPRVCALRDRVRVVADDTLSETAAGVVLVTDNGVFDAAHDLNAPMTLDVKTDRVLSKSAALIGQSRTTAAWAALRNGTVADLVAVIS